MVAPAPKAVIRPVTTDTTTQSARTLSSSKHQAHLSETRKRRSKFSLLLFALPDRRLSALPPALPFADFGPASQSNSL